MSPTCRSSSAPEPVSNDSDNYNVSVDVNDNGDVSVNVNDTIKLIMFNNTINSIIFVDTMNLLVFNVYDNNDNDNDNTNTNNSIVIVIVNNSNVDNTSLGTRATWRAACSRTDERYYYYGGTAYQDPANHDPLSQDHTLH